MMDTPNENALHERHQPFRLVVLDGRDPSRQLSVTILKSMPLPPISELQPELSTGRGVFVIPRSVQGFLPSGASAHLCRIEAESSLVRFGFLTKHDPLPDVFEYVPIMEDEVAFFLNQEVEFPITEPQAANCISQILSYWKDIPALSSTERPLERVKFSMKPPEIPQPKIRIHTSQVNLSPQSEKDPLKFITKRYYTTLYSVTTPLNYFPKTALSRLRIMCSDEADTEKEILLQVFHTPTQLIERQSNKFGLAPIIDGESGTPISNVHEVEAECQKQLQSKMQGLTDDPAYQERLLLNLKLREAQLQVLILLELLTCFNVDESFLLGSSQKQSETQPAKSKPSLVRKRNKRVVVPTFMGLGVPQNEPPTLTTDKSVTEQTLFQSLETFVDQIGLWETLIAGSSPTKGENVFGFIGYVVLPYFNKKLPKIVQHIIKLVKNLRLKQPKARKLKSENLKGDRNDLPSKVAAFVEAELKEGVQAETTKRSSKFAKQSLSIDKHPFLHRAATIATADSTDLKPAFLLKRSKSNLMSKNFKKRQIDMSTSHSEGNDEGSQKEKLFLFTDARRIKSSLAPSGRSMCEVEATPMKKAKSEAVKDISIFETPSRAAVPNTPIAIEATPQNGSQGSSLHAKLLDVSLATNSLHSIVSSPINELEGNKVFLRDSPLFKKPSSFSPIDSSPIEQKTKPGQQIPLLNSPFIGHALSKTSVVDFAASPVQTYQVTARAHAEMGSSDDSDSDYDKLLAAAAKPSIKRYPKKRAY